ncbi:TPA: LacI family DNA-binding transcriptional regulator [Kluyvera cryocrescens]|nr:LacI family DNA-binding transcriptional regulator [Kluyvera cryocrescens]
MKSITLYDVARVARVSYQTVSRVINQAVHLSPCTRHKVQAAMRDDSSASRQSLNGRRRFRPL